MLKPKFGCKSHFGVLLKHQKDLIKKYIFVEKVVIFGVCMVYINSKNFGLESSKKEK